MPDNRRDADDGGFAPLRIRNYRLFWFGGMVANTGRWVQAITVPFILKDLTGSSFWVGLGAAAQLVPMALIGPFVASIADRHQRRSVLLLTQSLQAAISSIFLLIWLLGVRAPGAYVVVSALSGAAAGMNLPTWQAFVGDLVPRPLLMRAVTLNSAQFNTARAVGPVISGFLLGTLGPGWAFGVNVTMYAAVLVGLWLIDVPDRDVVGAGAGSVLADLADGIAEVGRLPGVRAAMTVAAIIGLFGLPIIQTLVALERDLFDNGPEMLGWMFSANGVGAMTAAVGVSMIATRFRRSQIARVALGLYGVTIIAFGLSPSVWWAFVALFLLGACHLANAATMNTTVQLQVDDSNRGKILALYLTALLISSPVGALTMGALTDAVGPRPTIVGFGLGLLLVWLLLDVLGILSRIDDDVPAT